MLFAIGTLGTAWIRIRKLEFDVNLRTQDWDMVLTDHKSLQAEFERWKEAARENYDRLTAEIAELKQTLTALKKKNTTLKGQLTKERKTKGGRNESKRTPSGAIKYYKNKLGK